MSDSDFVEQIVNARYLSENYVSRQQHQDDLKYLPYLTDKQIRHMVDSTVAIAMVKQSNGARRQVIIAGVLGLLGGLVSSGLMEIF